jgi:cell division protein ZapA
MGPFRKNAQASPDPLPAKISAFPGGFRFAKLPRLKPTPGLPPSSLSRSLFPGACALCENAFDLPISKGFMYDIARILSKSQPFLFGETEADPLSESRKNKIAVEIYGRQYVIVGDESESHIRKVAAIVDEKMREMKSRNPSLDTAKLAVLTAVNAVHEYLKLQEEMEKYKYKKD